MHGSETKIHKKFEILPEDLSRLRSIALHRGSVTSFSMHGGTNSIDLDRVSSRMDLSSRDESVRTFIPTGESESLATVSIGDPSDTRSHVDDAAELQSNPVSADDERSVGTNEKESARKTDVDDDVQSNAASFEGILSRPGTRSPALSESALSSKKRSRSVTFLTQDAEDEEENSADEDGV